MSQHLYTAQPTYFIDTNDRPIRFYWPLLNGTLFNLIKGMRKYRIVFFRILSTFMWGRCVLWDASVGLDLQLPPLTILSPTTLSWCYPTISALVFLSFFSATLPSPSLSCLRIIRLLFSIQSHTTLTFLYFLGYFSHIRCPSNSVMPNSVQLGDSTHPS